jgi:hypothetical protein
VGAGGPCLHGGCVLVTQGRVGGAEETERAPRLGGGFVEQGGGALRGEPAEVHREGVVHAVSGEGAEGVGQVSAGIGQLARDGDERTDAVAEMGVGLGVIGPLRRGGLSAGRELDGAVLHVVPSAPVGGDRRTIFSSCRFGDQATFSEGRAGIVAVDRPWTQPDWSAR